MPRAEPLREAQRGSPSTHVRRGLSRPGTSRRERPRCYGDIAGLLGQHQVPRVWKAERHAVVFVADVLVGV